MKQQLGIVFSIIVVMVLGVGGLRGSIAGQEAGFTIDPDDIGGVVSGVRGPEAGVWVIAETHDFDTRFARIVVTDGEGRFVIPDLPEASYEVWARGYGLIDSDKITAAPGDRLDIRAADPPNRAAAAQYYPAAWWTSLIEAPPADAFPIGDIQTQAEWIRLIKGDWIRQQYGLAPMRDLHPDAPAFAGLGLETTLDVLNYVRNAGQYAEFGGFTDFDRLGDVGLQVFANWIDDIRGGAIPEPPQRPQGLERGIVVTTWDASVDTAFSHDIVASDKRDPTVNANGNVFFADWHNDTIEAVDPVRHLSTTLVVPTIGDRFSVRPFTRQAGWENPSLTFGNDVMVQDYIAPGSLAMDQQGRVWVAARISTGAPDFCQAGSGNPYAEIDPTDNDAKDFAVYDPVTGEWELVPLCYGNNHPTMAVDGTNKVFVQGGNSRFLWVDTDIWDQTRDPEAAQGWCRLFFDSDGDGLPNYDAPVDGAPYGPQQSLLDGSIWGTVQMVPGRIIRLSLGDNPPMTCVGEVYNVPEGGAFSRGVDVDSNGVVWTGLAGSGHLASFDRSKCERPLTGPEAMTGDHCREGWTLHPTPGPRMANTGFSSDFHYYNFVDKYNVIGLGLDTPLVNGTNSDSLMALVDPATNEWVTFRLPYPIGGLYTRNMSVRVDDPNAGWKGTGLWAANDTRAVWHGELGRESRGLVVKFQLRPDALAH